MNRWISLPRCFLFLGVCLAMNRAALAQEPERSSDPDVLLLDLGHREINQEHLGYGWSSPEKIAGRFISWTNRLEADIRVSPGAVANREVRILSVPLPHGKRNQRIGLYVNHRFVGEWVIPFEQQELTWQGCPVPAAFWREGENILTFRVAHLSKPASRDKRRLGLKVDKVWIAPAGHPLPGTEAPPEPESP